MASFLENNDKVHSLKERSWTLPMTEFSPFSWMKTTVKTYYIKGTEFDFGYKNKHYDSTKQEHILFFSIKDSFYQKNINSHNRNRNHVELVPNQVVKCNCKH